jgi:hypothetical protein
LTDKKEIWTPEKKLAYLPTPFPRESFIEEAKFLYEDLLNNRLKVTTRPAPIQTHADHKIRIVQSYNPDWYSDFYYSHTRGKRQLVEKSLQRLINRLDRDFIPTDNRYKYDTSLRWIIYSRLTEGYQTKEGDKICRVFPDNAIRDFFHLEKLEIPDEELKIDRTCSDVVPF